MTAQTATRYVGRVAAVVAVPDSHPCGNPHQRAGDLTGATYCDPVTSADVRRRLWALYVRRAVEQAKIVRGWSVAQIAEASKADGAEGVSSATIYRWMDPKWENLPRPEQVESFCDALDLATGPAFAKVWPGKTGLATETEPLPSNPDAEAIQRKLNDPRVSDAEKHLLRENLRMLALRGR